MGTTLLLVAMIAPANPGQFIGVQNHVAFEHQRQAVEHFHIVGNPGGQSRLAGQAPVQAGGRHASRGIGQAGIMYDLAIHPSSVGGAMAPHPAMRRIPSRVPYRHRPAQTPQGHGVWTAPKTKHQQETRAKPPAAVKRPQPTHVDRDRDPDQSPRAAPRLHHRPPTRRRPEGATLAQAMVRVRNLKTLAQQARRRNLSDVAGWLDAEAERLSRHVRTLQERREFQYGLGLERHHLTRELDRIRRMEQLLGEIGKAEMAGNPRRAKTLMAELRSLSERRQRPH